MHEMMIVLHREFVERVRSKSFILSTILLPVFMLGIFLVPIFMEAMKKGGETALVVVDEGPAAVGQRLIAALGTEPATKRDERFTVTHLRTPLASVRDSLNAAVLAEKADAYLYIPAGVVSGSNAEFRGRSVTNLDVQERIEAALSEAVQAERLNDAGLQITEVAALLRPVRVEATRITRGGEEGESAVSGLLFSLITGFVLYMLILLYGAQVMQSVQEEKTNRISEVLVSSLKASHLMLGKVLGVGLVALLQVVIWAVFAALLFGQRDRILAAFDLPARATNLFDFGVEPLVMLALLGFLIGGFFLYASLFAAAGAAAQSSEDAQRFTFPLITPLILPMIMQQQIVSDPRGTLATVLGWFPLTSPIVMPMRIGAGSISPLEIVGTLIVLALSIALLGMLTGKIYRIGILSTGKRPTLRELGRWLRTA